jgi:hypothetical protein
VRGWASIVVISGGGGAGINRALEDRGVKVLYEFVNFP